MKRIYRILLLLLMAPFTAAHAGQATHMAEMHGFCPVTLAGMEPVYFEQVPDGKMLAGLMEEFAELGPSSKEPVEFASTTTDLNLDGRKDVLTLSRHPLYCGSSGCQVHAFIQRDDGSYYPVFLFPAGAGQIILLPQMANGYRMLLLESGAPKQENLYQLYSWENGTYTGRHHCILPVKLAH